MQVCGVHALRVMADKLVQVTCDGREMHRSIYGSPEDLLYTAKMMFTICRNAQMGTLTVQYIRLDIDDHEDIHISGRDP
jgi:hypothetical protein